jgi:hypothetical protein
MSNPITVRVGKRDIPLAGEAVADFWSKVLKAPQEGGCWLWAGPKGEGKPIFWHSSLNTTIPALRLSIVLAAGGDDGVRGRRVYACEDRADCVNPDHARWWHPKWQAPAQSAQSSHELVLPDTLTRLAAAQGQDVATELDALPPQFTMKQVPRGRPEVTLHPYAGLRYEFLRDHVTGFVRFPGGTVHVFTDQNFKTWGESLDDAVDKAIQTYAFNDKEN